MVDKNSVKHQISLCAPQDRVWLALTDPEQFGYWFGATFDAGTALVEGARVSGRIAPTRAAPQTARTQKSYLGAPLALTIEGVEATTRLSFRWHPFAWEVGVEDPNEPKKGWARVAYLIEKYLAGARDLRPHQQA
jgi:uncharacterized protein YndB with AHSA1/START domain